MPYYDFREKIFQTHREMISEHLLNESDIKTASNSGNSQYVSTLGATSPSRSYVMFHAQVSGWLVLLPDYSRLFRHHVLKIITDCKWVYFSLYLNFDLQFRNFVLRQGILLLPIYLISYYYGWSYKYIIWQIIDKYLKCTIIGSLY